MKEFLSGKGSGEEPSDSQERIPAKPMLLLVDGKEQVLDSEEFFERHKVTMWVRIPSEEFDANFGTVVAGQLIDHFNLGSPNHVPDKRYLFMKIERGGLPLPLLSPDGAFVVECVSEKDHAYDSLTPEDFEHSFKGIGDKESLMPVIQKRYKASPEEIAQKGIAHTVFRVVESPEKD